MDFHFLVLCLLESPNFLDYKNLVRVKYVHKLGRLVRHHKCARLIYIHANVKVLCRDCQRNHVEKGNVEKLIMKKQIIKMKKKHFRSSFENLLCWANSRILHTCKSL